MKLVCKFYVQGDLIKEMRLDDNDKSLEKAVSKWDILVKKNRSKNYPDIVWEHTGGQYGLSTEIILRNSIVRVSKTLYMDIIFDTEFEDCFYNTILIGDYLVRKDVFDKVNAGYGDIRDIRKQLMSIQKTDKRELYLRSVGRWGKHVEEDEYGRPVCHPGIPDVTNLTQDILSGYVRIDRDKLENYHGGRRNLLKICNMS